MAKHRRRGLPQGLTRLMVDSRGTRASLTVPAKMARLIGTEQVFRFELTEEGILFRAVDPPKEEENEIELPQWMGAE